MPRLPIERLRTARVRVGGRSLRVSSVLLFVLPLLLVTAGSIALSSDLALLDPAHGIWGLTQPWGNQSFTLQGLSGPVTVIRDGAGTVHIYAGNDPDLMFAQGFSQASDRLFQMEIESLAAQGNVSTWVGQAGVPSDVAFRTLGLPQAALEIQANMAAVSPEMTADVQAYSAGVNSYIAWAEAHDRLPLFFTGLGVKPYAWTPYATFAFQELMTWGQTTGIVEPLMAALATAYVGDNATNEMFAVYPQYWQNFTVLPGDGSVNGVGLSSRGVAPSYVFAQDWLAPWATGIGANEEHALVPLYKAALAAINDPYVPLPRVDQGAGSNSWVVAANHSADHLPMVANDPHLPIMLPSLWVPTELVDPSYNVAGWSLAGLPGILIGHNPHVAWALTNSEGATALDYVETLNASDNTYLLNGTWRPITTLSESWNVAASASNPAYTKHLTLNSTSHGPMLARLGGYGISLRWAADHASWEAMAEMQFDRAVSLSQFFQVLHTWWVVPNLNVLVGENNRTSGTTHIGWLIPAHYPLVNVTMPNGQWVWTVGSRAPMNGTGAYEQVSNWVPPNLQPQVVDPAQGYLYAPNQPTVGQNYPFPMIGGWWDSGGRGHAIGTFLAQHPTMSIPLMQELQANVTDQWAIRLAPQLVLALQSVQHGSDTTAAGLAGQALPLVQGWNGSFDTDEVAPTVYSYWMDELQNLSYQPIVQAAGLTNAPDPFPDAVLWMAQNDPNSTWFKGGWASLSSSAAATALDVLQAKLSAHGITSISGWTWGVVHPFTMPSLTGQAEFAVGPYPWWGDGYTVSVAPFQATPVAYPLVQVSISSSLRMVSEPDPSATGSSGGTPVGGTAWGIIPGGASENPVSPYYANQLGMWLGHTYVDMSLVPQAGPFPQQVVSVWNLEP